MERVQALAEKFKNQLALNANKSELRQTLILMLTELDEIPQMSNFPNNISVIMPYEVIMPNAIAEPEMKIMEKPKAIMVEVKEAIVVPKNKLVDQKEVKQEINEVKLETKEVAEHIALEPIKDLKAAIGINDKFQFIQELFVGDDKDFESCIKTINAFNIYAEAQYWIKKELRIKNNWDEASPTVKAFDQLVKRRFS